MDDLDYKNEDSADISVTRTGSSVRISNVSEELMSEVIEPIINKKNNLGKS